eukprot:XP_001699265.1 hypothetical protein CHLREDRAFT_206019 [Chlamydomonas reinhardtii]
MQSLHARSTRTCIATQNAATRRAVVVQASKGFGAAQPKKFVQRKDAATPDPCPCESGKAYKNCCGPYHRSEALAPTPEATLRARFAAFNKAEPDYILNTTHPDYHIHQYNVPTPGGAQDRLREDVATGCNRFAYTGLKIVKTEPGVNEYEGYVAYEYLSRKRSAPGAPITEAEVKDAAAWSRTAERGRFLKTSTGLWQFVDAQTATFDASMLSGLQEPAAAQ